MKRTLNQTGRQRILLEHASAVPIIDGANRSILFTWDLSTYDLDLDAEIVIEVSLTGQEKRFVVGKLGDVPPQYEAKVEFLRDAKSAKATLYVSKADPEGIRIIQATTATHTILFEKEPDGGNSPLQIQLVDELATVWRLEYKDGKPVLQITNRNGVYAQLKANPLFFPTILPQVIKELAFHLFASPGDFQSNEEVWINFFKAYGLADQERISLQAADEEDDDVEKITMDRWDRAERISNEWAKMEKIVDEIQTNLGEDSF
jgi:hypothetical protein